MLTPSDLLVPVEAAVAAVLAGAHDALVAAGLPADAGLTWAAAIVVLVVVVRAALLPLVLRGLRSGRAAALARPQLQALTERYRGRTDAASLAAYRREVAAVRAEHGLSPLGCLPLLVQLPVLLALYRVLVDIAHGTPIGAMDAGLVASADAARLGGIGIGDAVLPAFGGGEHARVVALAALVLGAAALTYVTQRWFVLPGTNLADVPEPMAGVQRAMPAVAAIGVVVGAGAVPAGVLVYWLATNAWSLGQQAAINRWSPTPGSPAHEAYLARRLPDGARPGQGARAPGRGRSGAPGRARG